MRRFLQNGWCLVFLVFSVSCQNELKLSSSYDYKLIPKDTLRISIDDSLTYRYTRIQYFIQDDSTYIVVSNTNQNGLTFVNVDSERISKKVIYSQTGLNGVGDDAGSFHYVNMDSIFIFNSPSRKLFLTNSNADVIESFDLIDFADFDFGEPMMWIAYASHYAEGVLKFSVLPTYLNGHEISRNSNDPVVVKFDINAKKVSKGLIDYSYANMNNHHYIRHTPISVVGKDNVLYYCFPFENRILFENQETGIVEEKTTFVSDFVKEYYPMQGEYKNDIRRFDVEFPYNANLKYDPFRNVYYMVVYHGIPFVDDSTGELRSFLRNLLALLFLMRSLKSYLSRSLKEEIFFLGVLLFLERAYIYFLQYRKSII